MTQRELNKIFEASVDGQNSNLIGRIQHYFVSTQRFDILDTKITLRMLLKALDRTRKLQDKAIEKVINSN